VNRHLRPNAQRFAPCFATGDLAQCIDTVVGAGLASAGDLDDDAIVFEVLVVPANHEAAIA